MKTSLALLFLLPSAYGECHDNVKAKPCKEAEGCHWQFDDKTCLTTAQLEEKIKNRPCSENGNKGQCDINDKCDFIFSGKTDGGDGECMDKSLCGDETFENTCLDDFMAVNGCDMTKEEIEALAPEDVDPMCMECVTVGEKVHAACEEKKCGAEDFQDQCILDFLDANACTMTKEEIEALDGSVIDPGCYMCDVIKGMAHDECLLQYPTCIKEGMRTTGLKLGVWGGVMSVDDCSSGCLANPQCEVWTYYPKRNQCKLVGSWPKRGPAGFKKGKASMKSGTKACNNGEAVPLPEQ